MHPRLLPAFLCGLLGFLAHAVAHDSASPRAVDRTTRETLLRAERAIEDETDTRVALEVDAASFGDDRRARGNLHIVANRVVGALSEIGKDQVGKDAIAQQIRRVRIVRIPAETKEDRVLLEAGTLLVQTSATDEAMAVLQGIITRHLETALNLAPPNS